MNELRELVMRYIRELSFADFRRAFVEQFLATANTDTAVWQAVVQIESACADFSESEAATDEGPLKRNLARIVDQASQIRTPEIVVSINNAPDMTIVNGTAFYVGSSGTISTRLIPSNPSLPERATLPDNQTQEAVAY